MNSRFKISLGICLILLSHIAFAQNDDIIANVAGALKASSSRELSNFLHSKVEIKLGIEKKEYSKNQAEAVLKNFFQQYPAENFTFIHKGNNSSGAIRYAIGKYVSTSSEHRVLVRAKRIGEVYKVYRLEFSEK